MTYRSFLDRNIGYKLQESKDAIGDRKSPVLLKRTFAEIVEQFHPQDVDDCGLYLRMKDAYEHSKVEFEPFEGKKLNVVMKRKLLAILLERDALLNSMNLVIEGSEDEQKATWYKMTLDDYCDLMAREKNNG